MRNTFSYTSLLGVTTLIGCGAVTSNARNESTTAAIRAAEEVGAQSVPRAALHLQMAKEESEQAKALAAKGEKEEAQSLLLRAEADANLAVMLSREDAERTEAAAAVKRVQAQRSGNLID